MPSYPLTDHPPDDHLWPMNKSVTLSHDSLHTIMTSEGNQNQNGHHLDQSIDQIRTSRGGSGGESGCKGQCYISIIQRLTQLEQTLATDASQIRLDHLITAVRSAGEAKECLFNCHSRCNAYDTCVEASGSGMEGAGCLDSLRPGLLLLAVFLERVVGLLEYVFRRTASAAYELDRRV
ncbi:hypothetical protein F5Y09DRAFT_310324 [Xylaria sp. FL1042]|nr:hypothetical protein F5Y09DRAFT_310324 [Xylaria sp. FL1042]